MTVSFFDTSAWAKGFFNESGTRLVLEHLNHAGPKAISVLSLAELHLAARRKMKEGLLSQKQIDSILCAAREFFDRAIVVPLADVTGPLYRRACELVIDGGLRVMDAFQLASAVHVKEQTGQPVDFICADRRLHKPTLTLGLTWIDLG